MNFLKLRKIIAKAKRIKASRIKADHKYIYNHIFDKYASDLNKTVSLAKNLIDQLKIVHKKIEDEQERLEGIFTDYTKEHGEEAMWDYQETEEGNQIYKDINEAGGLLQTLEEVQQSDVINLLDSDIFEKHVPYKYLYPNG